MNWIHRSRRRAIRGAALGLALWLTLGAPGAARAANTIWWCPGVLPMGDPGCLTAGTIQAAVNAAELDGVPGTIFIEEGTYNEADIVVPDLDTVIFIGNAGGGAGTIVNADFTFNGTKNLSFDAIQFDSLTLNNGNGFANLSGNRGPVIVNGGSFKKAPGVGLEVSSHRGPITLNDVSVSKSGSDGVFLDNTASVGAQPITLNGGSFSSNADRGMLARSNGDITVTDLEASKNGSSGIVLDNTFSTTSSAINLLASPGGGSRFDKNGSNGALLFTEGSITVIDVTASKNGSDGLALRNNAGAGSVNVQAGAGEQNRFEKNGGNGLDILSAGSVTVFDIRASKNGQNGLIIDADAGTGDVTVTTTQPELNRLEKNEGDGLEITAVGEITVRDVNASRNVGYGLWLDNAAGTNPVTISIANAGQNRADKNGQDGVYVVTQGNIEVLSVAAEGNTGNGAYLYNQGGSGTVLVQPAVGETQFNKNDSGLVIFASDQVGIVDVSANANDVDGLYVSTTSVPVVVTCGVFNDNDDDGIHFTVGSSTLTVNGGEQDGNGTMPINMEAGTLVLNPAVCGP